MTTISNVLKIIFISLLLFVFILTSCNDYLNVELQDQMTLEEVFDKRQTTERYLAQIYGRLPRYDELQWYTEGSVVPRSDEALYNWLSGAWIAFRNGNYGPATNTLFENWRGFYVGIREATIFMQNADLNTELPKGTIETMKAEARFLRAFFYFLLFKQYGPVYVWGDRMPDFTVRPEEIDRHSVDVNIDFMVSEIDKAVENLPLNITEPTWYGRVTKGAAMATKSRITLYAARPLFNGTELYKGMRNYYGDFIFPQNQNSNKWEIAAKAAKDVIDLNNYNLYTDNNEKDEFRKAIKSYQGVWFDKWNDEVIWGVWCNSAMHINVRCSPPNVVVPGYGGFSPSLKLVDTYPMAESGRYPVTGYFENGQPIIDPLSGYSDTGFTDQYIHPLDTFALIKAHNSCVGRDARFYASVLANGMYWINTYRGKKIVTFYQGGTSSYKASGDAVRTGYLWRRFTDPANDTESSKWGQFAWPIFRLAEIYLNYAEACNEKPNRDEKEALLYFNKVRSRSGLNNIEEAYPEVIGNKDLFRKLLQKERMVELSFESHRYYDSRTWMIALEEENTRDFTRNVIARNYEDSWQRTDQVMPGRLVCEPKHLLFPIHQAILSEMVNFTQNYGW